MKYKEISLQAKDTLFTLVALTRDKRYLTVSDYAKEATTQMCEIADRCCIFLIFTLWYM